MAENVQNYDEEDELVTVEIDYVSAPTLNELRKKVNKKLDQDWSVAEGQNPFFDSTNNVWVREMWYQMLESELDEK